MAWSSVAIPADEASALAADKPLLCGKNHVRTARATGDIVWSDADSSYPATDESDADGPAALLGDDRLDLQSFADAADTRFWVHFSFGEEVTVDHVVIANHNLNTIGASLWIILADSGMYTGNAEEILTSYVVPSDERVTTLHTNRLGGVTHMRLRIDIPVSSVARIGEVWAGERQQLNHQPDEPWLYTANDFRVDRWETVNGANVNYVRHHGQRFFSARMTAVDSTIESRLQSWRKGCDHGARPFLWIDEPQSEPEKAFWMQSGAGIEGSTDGPVARVYEVTAREVGQPFVANET